MKLAGLMCWHYDAIKTLKHHDSIADLCAVCDEVFILDDQSDPPFPKEWLEKYPQIQSVIRIDERAHEWNDWTAHNTLMLAAAKRQCTHVLWLDDDESLYPCNRELVWKQLEKMQSIPTSVAIKLYWRHVWNEENKILMEGIFKYVRKPFLQKNPFYISGLICFPNSPDIKIHSWPVQSGSQIMADAPWVLHWGLFSPADRESYTAKYKIHDPEGKFASQHVKEYLAAVNCPNPELLDLNEMTHDWWKWRQ